MKLSKFTTDELIHDYKKIGELDHILNDILLKYSDQVQPVYYIESILIKEIGRRKINET